MKTIFQSGKLFVLASLFLASCASNPSVGSLTSEQRVRLASMEVTKKPAPGPSVIIESVKGLSCHRNSGTAPYVTETEALDGVKIKAAFLNADAVVNVACKSSSGPDWVNNCWASVVCIGDAVRYPSKH